MRINKVLSLLFCTALFTAGAAYAQETSKVYKVGDLKVVSVKDQSMTIDASILHAPADVLKKYLPDGKCEASLNIFVVDDGKNAVLIDTGLGGFGGGMGVETLATSGYPTDKFTGIILTHLHGDHFGGLIKKGSEASDASARTFKNAKIYVPKDEFAFWMDKKNMNKAPKGLAFTFDAVPRLAKIYGDRIVTYEKGKEPIKGFMPVAAPGHTPGHTMYKISSKGQEMLIWGDIIHCLAAQIKDPSITIDYDADTKLAAKSRAEVLKSVSKSKIPVAGMHLPFPGVIVITETPSGYDYTPAK